MTNLATQNERIRKAQAKREAQSKRQVRIAYSVAALAVITLVMIASHNASQRATTCFDQGQPIACSMLINN